MKITVCGSVAFIGEMKAAKETLEAAGHKVYIPLSAELNQSKDFWANLRKNSFEEFAKTKAERIKGHFHEVKNSDAILVLNYTKNGRTNYIGPNTLMEIAVAFEYGKKIYILNRVPEDDNLYEEIISVSPTFIDGDLEKIR